MRGYKRGEKGGEAAGIRSKCVCVGGGGEGGKEAANDRMSHVVGAM